MATSQEHIYAAALESRLGVAATTHYGTWISYTGTARIVLAVILIAAAGGATLLGSRLPLPVSFKPRSKRVVIALGATWLLATVAFLAGATGYVVQLQHEHLAQAAPADPITPVTVVGVGVVFMIVAISSARGWRTTLRSAAIIAAAGPVIFELPFDLVIMARTYPAVPPDPALYRALFFAPFLLVQVTVLALLTCSPQVRLSRATCYLVAVMLTIFAIWGLLGFGYPATPAPFALNVLSKIVAFVVALSLYVPDRTRRPSPVPDHDQPGERSIEYAGLFGQDATGAASR